MLGSYSPRVRFLQLIRIPDNSRRFLGVTHSATIAGIDRHRSAHS